MTLLVTGCSKPEEVISSRVALANQNLEAGKIDDAVKILERLNRKYERKPAVLEALGFAYARAGNHGAAGASFVQAADADEASSVLRQLAAEAFFNDGNFDKAAEQHRLFLAKYPGDYQSWQKLGEIEEARGDVPRAIDAYLEWYRIRPDGECSYRLGAAFRRLNNSPQAKTWFEATIKHGEANIEQALLGLLELEVEAGQLAAAEKTAGQLDQNFPGRLDASPLAGVRQRIEAWKVAEAALAEARAEQGRLTRELEQARRERLQEIEAAALSTARPDTAQPEAPREAEARDNEPAPPLIESVPSPETEVADAPAITAADLPPELRSAIERKEGGDAAGAIEMLWRALGNDDSRVEFWIELADCYRSLKQFPQAEACILEARRRSQDSLEVETTYLNIVRESQASEVYLARVEEARRKFPGDANLAYVFAHELAAAEGDASRTISAYEDFLLLADPRDPRRGEAAQFLARARR